MELPEIDQVNIEVGSQIRGRRVGNDSLLQGVKNVIAVASGKGGVGKSTVAANLALALSEWGTSVGLLDADIYGPSMPTMMGLLNEKPTASADGLIEPLRRHDMSVMSMGFLLGDDAPVIWRGPMVHKIIQQFLGQVNWGALDYLVIDLPPGTGDAQLTLTQTAPLSGAVIVTTPQDVSLLDARKGLRMFQQVNVPVLGIVENMSYYLCPHCGDRAEIFRHGGGKKVSEELNVPFLGEIPIESAVAEGGDQGAPVVTHAPESAAADAFRSCARQVVSQLMIHSFDSAEIPGLKL
jgi:ATP-binding protein involved in chromosome partitioning